MNIVISIASSLNIAQPTHEQSTERCLQLLNELTATNELLDTLQELKNEQENLTAQLRIFDLTDPRDFNKRIQMLEELCSSLKQFCLGKNDILRRLQQPLTTNTIIIEYCHQEDFMNLIGTIVSSLSSLEQSIDSIRWMAEQKIDKSQLEQLLHVIPNILARHKQYMEDVVKMRALMEKNKLSHVI